MKRTVILGLAVALLAAMALSASAQPQPSVAFVTRVHPAIMTPGAKVEVAAIFTSTRVPLLDRRCLFLVGLRYNPKAAPYVVPPIPLGIGPFKVVQHGGKKVLAAAIRLVVPRKLPKGLHLPLFLQGVALVKTPKGPRIAWAQPAKALLKT